MRGQALSGPDRHQVGLGTKLPLVSGLDQHITHLGQANLPEAQGKSLA